MNYQDQVITETLQVTQQKLEALYKRYRPCELVRLSLALQHAGTTANQDIHTGLDSGLTEDHTNETLSPFLTALALASFTLPSHAQSGIPCGTREQIKQQLEKKYKEFPAWRGLASPKVILELFEVPGGSWTLLRVTPDGMACVIGSGRDSHKIAAPKGTAL